MERTGDAVLDVKLQFLLSNLEEVDLEVGLQVSFVGEQHGAPRSGGSATRGRDLRQRSPRGEGGFEGVNRAGSAVLSTEHPEKTRLPAVC